MIRMITTVFGVGLLPKAPGTWGTALAVPLGYLLHGLGGPLLLAIATAATFALGVWAIRIDTQGKADHDPGEIVIDEVVGLWITLLPVSYGLAHAGVAPWTFPWPGWIAAFVLFRLFDIFKPWPVSRADALHTPLGVMLDDVVAGIMAGICVIILAILYHVPLMT